MPWWFGFLGKIQHFLLQSFYSNLAKAFLNIDSNARYAGALRGDQSCAAASERIADRSVSKSSH